MDKHPSIIGPYLIETPLGQGGMGVVYRGRHITSGQTVAIKTVLSSNSLQFESIRREIKALARIQHPGVINIVDDGLDEGLPWYAMEFIQGITLKDHIRKLYMTERGYDCESRAEHRSSNAADEDVTPNVWWTQSLPLVSSLIPGDLLGEEKRIGEAGEDSPATTSKVSTDGDAGDVREILSLIRQICYPLAFIHGEGIVHRDLKPENIIINAGGVPVLVDFGLMTEFGGDVSREILRVERGGIGTVNYMAPEQIRGEIVDARADLYSLGCIIYELLVGRPPFLGNSPSEIVRAHLFHNPVAVSHFRSDIPSELNNLVIRLLNKESVSRLGYADTVAVMLSRMIGDGTTHSVSMGPKPRPYLYRPRFAGRENQLAQLHEHSHRLQEGQGGFVLLTGESGVGKTRLVKEFAIEAAIGGQLILAGECSEHGRLPLEAFMIPLRSLADRCQELGKAETEKLFGARGKLLAAYESSLLELPGIIETPDYPDLPAEAAMHRLFQYLADTLAAVTKENRIILILDDLQWSDELSIKFLKHLHRGNYCDHYPILLIGLFRSEDLSPAVAKLLQEDNVDLISISRLTDTSIASLIGDMLAMDPPPTLFSQFLTKHSGGNPFFVAEYIRAAVEEGLLLRDDAGNWQVYEATTRAATTKDYEALPLPRSLKELVTRRLSDLSKSARALIEAASVIGRQSSLLILWEVTGIDDLELLDASDEVMRRQIMESIV